MKTIWDTRPLVQKLRNREVGEKVPLASTKTRAGVAGHENSRKRATCLVAWNLVKVDQVAIRSNLSWEKIS
ncbi:MAG TPA: hypothetical protein VKM55_27220 [Candidatus Lokiarchaeia archaeon]|nr:hypothetical protein [Candidatus Lokiarchaeia archaeon]